MSKSHSPFEKAFEFLLWNSRFITLLAVVFGILSSISLFVIASMEIWHTIADTFMHESHTPMGYVPMLSGIIGAIDLYLIGIVVLIFSFGVYELFISKIDIARLHEDLNILDIASLDELKNKLLKVIIMVLIVSFFKGVLSMNFTTPLDMLFFALSILALAVGVYLIRSKM